MAPRTRAHQAPPSRPAAAAPVEHVTLANHSKQTHVTIDQSLNVVKINTYGALSELLKIRRCVDQVAFGERQYVQKNRAMAYEDIANSAGAEVIADAKKGHGALRAHFLLRNEATPGGNKVLDWLERDVFPAIAQNAIQAMQLRVLEYNGSRAIETWVFAFSRLSSPVQQHRTDGSSWTMVDVTLSLSKALGDVHSLLLPLPALPKRKDLELVLSFNDTSGIPEVSALFAPLADANYDFAVSDEWKIRRQVSKHLNTNFHRLDFAIEHLEYRSQGPQQSPVAIPDFLPLTEHREVDDMFICKRRGLKPAYASDLEEYEEHAAQPRANDYIEDHVSDEHSADGQAEHRAEDHVNGEFDHDDHGDHGDRREGRAEDVHQTQTAASQSSTPSLDRVRESSPDQYKKEKRVYREDMERSKEIKAMHAGFRKPLVTPSQITERQSQAYMSALGGSSQDFDTLAEGTQPQVPSADPTSPTGERLSGVPGRAAKRRKRKSADATMGKGMGAVKRTRSFYISSDRVSKTSSRASSEGA